MLFHIFLYLHVLGAIIAFGPSFIFPIIGSMVGSEPGHANFGLRITHKISRGVIVPMAGLQGVTGVGLILTGGFNLTKALWLSAGIILYICAYSIGLFVLNPTTHKLVEMTETPPPAGAAGPPPEMQALVSRIRIFGGINTALIVVIVFLMVIKPGA